MLPHPLPAPPLPAPTVGFRAAHHGETDLAGPPQLGLRAAHRGETDLADTPTVGFRAVRHGETDLVDRVFAGLSAQSRYQRFHGPKPRLSDSERAYLSAVDGRDHLAVVALAPDGAPLGLARCVRLLDEPETADLAAEVVDDHQRQGIGMALVARLARRAAAAGIERLSATVLAETGLQRALLRRGWEVTATDGPALTLEVAVWTVATSRR
jgi:GNAT superfamily N-acetyltransferase